MADGGDVKIPGLGNVPKKKALIWGGVAIVAVGAILYIRSRKASAAAAAATPAATTPAAGSTGAYPPDGTTGDPSDPYSTDPATGLTYGDEGQAGSAAGYAYNAGGAYSGAGTAGTDAAGYPIGSQADQQWQASQTGTPGTGASVTTNSQWVQEALALLPGGASAENELALQSVLAGTAVTAAQVAIFNQAVAVTGMQPPGGYPPINQTDTAGQPGPGSTGTITIPQLAGSQAGAAHNALVALGLVPTAPATQHATDIVSSTSPGAGTKVNSGSRVQINAAAAPATRVTVPACNGQTAGNAHNLIVAAGLVPTAPAGQKAVQIVKSTTPPQGTQVAKGSHVQINT